MSGVVVKVNEAVKAAPSLVNTDPFGEGWLAEISTENLSELSALMDINAYKEYIL